jgi:lysozyme
MTPENLTLLRAELARDECVRLKPYLDSVGKLTIGTGRNLDDVGIREDENDYLLTNDIIQIEQDLDRYLPWWKNLDPVRQRVIANMCFNLGIGRLLGFKNTLPAIQNGRYEVAAQGMLHSLWARQVKQRAVRLADMMQTGAVS